MTSRSRLRTSVVPFAVLTALMLPLAACSGSGDSTGAVAAARAHASEVAKNAGSDGVTASEAAAASEGSTSGALDTGKVCADIKAATESVPGKDPVSTQAKLLGVLSSLFAPGGALAGRSGSALDDVTAHACPAVKDAALEQAGIDSFGKI